jgi:hypothetical protein
VKNLFRCFETWKRNIGYELIPETYENLAENERRRGNYKKAYSYQKLLFNEEKNKFINPENTKEAANLRSTDIVKKAKANWIIKYEKIQQLTLVKKK